MHEANNDDDYFCYYYNSYTTPKINAISRIYDVNMS